MNCRPNDVARVISPGRLTRCPFCGGTGVAVLPDTFVRVTQHDGIAWVLEDPIERTVDFPCGQQIHVRCRAIVDDLLRPIRDPGDDEVDQTLIYAGDPRVREVSHG